MKTLTGLSWITLICAAGLLHQTAQAQRSILKEFENAFVELSEDVRPSVVEISAESSFPAIDMDQLNDWRRFFGRPLPDDHPEPDNRSLPRSTATASGFIYDTLGHIVTNNHVVKDSERLTVTLWDGQKREAEVIGQDPDADLAVIKIDPEGLDLKPVRLGTSSTLKVGQFAIAMGSPNGLTGSFSYGHVTGLGRESLRLPDILRFQNFIQTDAAINLGNSGGPLCNIDGEVIGVNVAIVFRANSIGFAIPIDRVKEVVPQLIASGKVIRGWLGVRIYDIENAAMRADQELEDYMDAYGLPDKFGTLIQGLTPDGPAERAGLQEDDVIRELNGGEVVGPTDLINSVSALEPGTVATLGIWRKGKAMELKITIGEFPGITAATYGRDYFGMYVTALKLTPQALEQLGVDEEPTDFKIAEVEPDSPADKAGIKVDDIVLEVALTDITTLEDFKQVLKEEGQPGRTLLMRVQRLRPGVEPRKVYLKIPDDYEIN
ncbi:MAG: trypsin-like peptidase domain-containing protein [Candidatus Hydrogenedentes bacterium]|nr:trypsin-like peptidase domain-containing protein [Candidatus Hydrogenedentota bacterium]